MTKTLFATPEFTLDEVIFYLEKPYQQVKALINKKGYTFSKKEDNWYTFSKFKNGNKYSLTLEVENGNVIIVRVEELYSDYPMVLQNIKNQGFDFTQGSQIIPSEEFDEPPSKAMTFSMMRFDKQTKYTCFLICPYNLYNGTNLFSVSCSYYSK